MPNDPQSYWQSHEPVVAVETLEELHSFIESVSDERRLVWRGVKDEKWPLHSALYRYAMSKYEGAPTPARFLALEREIVTKARE